MNSETKEKLRGQIDAVDDQLIELLLKRIQLSNLIIEAKARGQIVDRKREDEIYRRYSERLAEVSTPAKIKGLVQALLATSRLYERP